MPDIGTAYLQIIPSLEGISSNIAKEFGGDVIGKQVGKQMGESTSQSFSATLQSKGKSMMKAGTIMSGVAAGFIVAGKKLIDMSMTQSNAEVKLTEIYKTRMGATEEAAKSTMKLASALQQQGIIGDEVTLSGAQQLATFAKMPGTVDKLLPAMDNLLVQQKGYNATAEDATNVANLMGKVLNGQTGALTRVGISFTEAQEKVLKYGTEEEKAAMLSEVITQNVGNMNAEFAKTDAGKIQQAKNTLGDLGEKLGASLLPALAKVATFAGKHILPAVEKVVNFIASHPVIGGIAVAITGILAVGGQLLMWIGGLVAAIGTITAAMSGLSLASLPITGTMMLVAAGIAALVAIIIICVKHWDQIKAKMIEVGNAVKSFFTPAMGAIKNSVKDVKEIVKAAFDGVKNAISTALTAAKNVVQTSFTVIKDIFFKFVPLGIVIKNFGAIKEAISSALSAAKNLVSRYLNLIKTLFIRFTPAGIFIKNFSKIKDGVTKPIQSVVNAVKGMVNKIKGFFKFSVPKPKIPVPHFGISPKGWKVGDLLKGKIPKLSVHWAAKGGIVDGATLIGAGEAGKEAIVPLDRFWNELNSFKADIAGSKSGMVVNQTINFNQPVTSPIDTARALKNQAITVGLAGV